MQQFKLAQMEADLKGGNVSLKDLNRAGEDISKLSDLDKSCYKILKQNLDETGMKYHVDSFKDGEGNRTFNVLFEDKNAPKVQQAVEKSLRQMKDPKFMKKMQEAAAMVKATPDTLADHIKKLQDELKAVRSENESLKAKEAQNALGDVMDKVVEIKGVKFLASSLKDVDMNGLRDLGDQLKEKLGSGVILLISEKGGKVNLMRPRPAARILPESTTRSRRLPACSWA